jgi:CHAT domain-containing protein
MRESLLTSRIVHVATHGVLNRQNPLFSRIDLARPRTPVGDDDGRLEVHEVIGLTVQASLVFLSGCETGAGSTGVTGFDQGEDFATLSQAFLLAGADNVVATLWQVRDDGAAEFARHFYEALSHSSSDGRRDVGAALAAAQRKMLADQRFDAPYHWAGYTAGGRGWLAGTG